MPLVNVMVNSRAYTVACDSGEEEHLRELAAVVDAKVRELLGSVGQVGDQRLVLMAALVLADELAGALHRVEALKGELAELKTAHRELTARLDRTEGQAADALEIAANRVEHIAGELGRA